MTATSTANIAFELNLRLTEEEARALYALTLYGFNPFLKTFYEHMGKSYMQPHEKGLKSLFDSVENELPKQLSRMDKTRNTFNHL
jgi:hypothetical protein